MSPTRLVIPASTAVATALRQVVAAGVPGAPVVNDDGAFIGSLQAATLTKLVDGGDERGRAGRVADVEAMTLPSDAGLDAVIDALPASKGGWVPVLDDDMRVLGIISTGDVVRVAGGGRRHE
jgi:predicted transcriptional regulator